MDTGQVSSQEVRDTVLAAERASEREQLVTIAMNAHVDLQHAIAAEIAAKKAAKDAADEVARCRAAYSKACARLVPLRDELDQVAA